MTQLLSRYQQAVLAELNIPIYQSKSVLTLDDSDASDSVTETQHTLSKPKPIHSETSETLPVETSQPVYNIEPATEQQLAEPQASELSTERQSPNEQVETRPDIGHIQPEFSSENVNSTESLAQAAAKPSFTEAQNQDEQAKRDREKTIADKTRMINQLASILPADSESAVEPESQVPSARLHLSGMAEPDLAAIQTWSGNNDWQFETGADNQILANHPELIETKSFDLSQSDQKKSFWSLVLSLT